MEKATPFLTHIQLEVTGDNTDRVNVRLTLEDREVHKYSPALAFYNKLHLGSINIEEQREENA